MRKRGWGAPRQLSPTIYRDACFREDTAFDIFGNMCCLKNQILVVKEILSRYVFDSKSVGASFEVFLQSIHLLLSSVSTVHARPSTPPALITTSPSGFVSFTPVFFIPCKLLPMLTQNLLQDSTLIISPLCLTPSESPHHLLDKVKFLTLCCKAAA